MIGGFASRIRASRREGCITILSSVMPEEGGKRSTYRRERGVCNTPNLHEPTILRWQDRAKGDFIKLFAPKSSGRTIIHRLLKNSFAAIPLLIGCLLLPPPFHIRTSRNFFRKSIALTTGGPFNAFFIHHFFGCAFGATDAGP